MKTAAVFSLVMGVGVYGQGGISMMSQMMPKKLQAFQEYRDEGLLPMKDISSQNGRTECIGGTAFTDHGEYDCRLTELFSFATHFDLGSTTGEGNDIWGWTDPETGYEYVTVGQEDGTAFVRIGEDGSIIYLGRLDTATEASSWRDMKVYNGFVFIGSEAPGHGIQIFDLRHLRDVQEGSVTEFEADVWYQGCGSSHNVVINEESGYLYVVGSDQAGQGLHMVNIQDPLNPVYEGDFSQDGYVHDAQCVIYDGPDPDWQGKEICACYNEDTLTFVDVSNKSRPRMISRVTYKGYAYTHQGWFNSEKTALYLDDELDERDRTTPNNLQATRTIIFNVTDLDAPFYTGDFISAATSIDHNQYVVTVQTAFGPRDYVLQANYTAGLRILQVRRGGFGLRERGFFDVHPEATGAEYLGSWSIYPYFKSGYVAVNSIERGLFIVQPAQLKPAPASTSGSIAEFSVADREAWEEMQEEEDEA